MNQRRFICLGLLLCGLLAGIARADSFHLNDGSTVTGDIVSANETGIRLRLPDGNYSDVVPWTKFSQDDLKKLAQDPKMQQYAGPFIEVTEEQRIQKTEVPITQPPRLKRPAPQSLFGALFLSSVGSFVIVLLYAAGIYAAYEVALFRRRPRGLVCGLAAVPVIGFLSPVLFLALPSQGVAETEEGEENYQPETTPAPEAPSFTVPGGAPARTAAPRPATPAEGEAAEPETPAETGGLKLAHEAPPTPAGAPIPQTQVFQRGAFMFNRRFFETKFPGFFGIVRRDADKDMVLIIRAARGEYHVDRISRISANDLHVQVRKAHATEEVMIPFTEVQEIRLKHKDSPH